MHTPNPKPKLETSKDYDRFFKHQNQQPMSDSHVSKIADLMKRVGFFPSKPIQVCRYGDKFGIIDGHHRFAAARSLGIAIYYVVEESSHADLIGDQNVLQRKWNHRSFVKLHAAKGNKNYISLLEYFSRGIPMRLAASLLLGHSAQSGNATKLIPTGKFVIKSTKSIDLILRVLDETKEIAPNISKQSYIIALSLALFVPDFSVEQLIVRIKKQPSAVTNAADTNQALDILEEVFNFRSKIKINLAFTAKELCKKRKAFGINHH
jgi:hypothetical protein